MAPRPLPTAVIALLERLVPSPRRAEVLGDLAEDYAHAQVRLGMLGARAWLCREVASLAAAWTRYAAASLFRARGILVRDLQMSCRSLARRPAASAASAAMLGVGLVAVALSGALRHVLLERPVSASRGDEVQRLVAIERSGREQSRFSALELERVEASVHTTASLAAVGLEPALVAANSLRRQTLAEIVTEHHADLLGMPMQRGRALMGPDFAAGAAPVAVISDVLWRELFGRSEQAVGAALVINGHAFVLSGIARAGAPTSFLGASVDVWVPMAQGDAFFSPGWRTNPASRAFSAFVLPHAPPAALDVGLERATADMASEYPDPWRERKMALRPATALLGTQRDAARLLSRILLALSALILVVAGANLGAMMLATAAAGRRAMAIHAAIGAGPGAAPRRLLLEGGLVGAAASLVAVGLYAWARTEIADVTLLPTLSLRLALPAPIAVLRWLVPAGMISGLLMAAGPAFAVARRPAFAALQGGGSRVAGESGVARARRVLVSAQMAMCLVLIVGASLFTRSLERLTNADLGIVREGLIALDFDIEPAGDRAQTPDALAHEALRRTRQLAGVEAAAMASRAPVDASTPLIRVSAPGAVQRDALEVTFNTVTSGYFETVGIPLVAGRAFTEQDAAGVAIVNETLARHLWPDGDFLGRALAIDAGARTVQVVGVARDAKYRAITDGARPHLYLPTAPAFGQALLVRTAADPRRMLLAVQDVLDEVGPGLAGFFPRTTDDHLAIQLLPTRVGVAGRGMAGRARDRVLRGGALRRHRLVRGAASHRDRHPPRAWRDALRRRTFDPAAGLRHGGTRHRGGRPARLGGDDCGERPALRGWRPGCRGARDWRRRARAARPGRQLEASPPGGQHGSRLRPSYELTATGREASGLRGARSPARLRATRQSARGSSDGRR